MRAEAREAKAFDHRAVRVQRRNAASILPPVVTSATFIGKPISR